MHWWLVAILITTTVADTRIYRENPPRVTTFCNRLGLSLSKCIRYRLIAKINSKRRPRTCEALDQILMNYSCTRHASASIASRHATPGEVSACVSLFLLSSTHFISIQRATHLISSFSSTYTSKVGLKSCHPPCINMPLKFIKKY
jgi:hypothetical protein